MSEPTPPLWERPALQRVSGRTLRPGGFALTDRAAEAAGLSAGWRVLDAGCGVGATVHRLRSRHGARAVGLEFSATQIGRAREGGLPAEALVRGRAEALPFAAGTFRMVFCECALSLTANPGATLRELARVLEPGGWLALSDLVRRGDGARRRTADDFSAPADENFRRSTSGGAAFGDAHAKKSNVENAGISRPSNAAQYDPAPADGRTATPPPSCARGALDEAELAALTERCGFALRLREGHDRQAAELAARLLLAGEAETSCACGGERRGYTLLVAQKTEERR